MKFQEFHYWVRHAKCTWSSSQYNQFQFNYQIWAKNEQKQGNYFYRFVQLPITLYSCIVDWFIGINCVSTARDRLNKMNIYKNLFHICQIEMISILTSVRLCITYTVLPCYAIKIDFDINKDDVNMNYDNSNNNINYNNININRSEPIGPGP